MLVVGSSVTGLRWQGSMLRCQAFGFITSGMFPNYTVLDLTSGLFGLRLAVLDLSSSVLQLGAGVSILRV